MAQRVDVKLVDDLDGSEATDSVAFALDGRQYEIDLSSENAARLRGIVADYVAAARRVGSARKPAGGGASTPAAGPDATAVRQWARENGVTVSERGRVPAHVVEAYLNRNAAAAPAEAPKAAPKVAEEPAATPAEAPAEEPKARSRPEIANPFAVNQAG